MKRQKVVTKEQHREKFGMATTYSFNALKKVAGISVLAVAAISAGGWQAEAATITRQLNCPISGGACTPGSTSWGTMTFKDNATNGVDISIDLTGNVNKILSFYLNYDDSKFGNTNTFKWNGANNSVDNSKNNVNSPGGGKGFDLAVPKNGNLNTFDTIAGTLTVVGGNLRVADLDFLTTPGGTPQPTKLTNIYAAVHIGNYGGVPGQPGGGSITVGAAPVPLPGFALGLLVTGAFGSTKLMKNRKTKQAAQTVSA